MSMHLYGKEVFNMKYGIKVSRFGKSAMMSIKFNNIHDAIDALEFYKTNSSRFTKYEIVELN
jgi:hypothetical protein